MPVQVAALSCMPWTVDDAVRRADESAQSYIVVHGVLQFNEKRLPVVDVAKQHKTPTSTRIAAKIKGTSLTSSGFSRPTDVALDLVVSCAGAWCAGVASGRPTLAFLETAGDSYVLRAALCSPMMFQNPSAEQLEAARACFSGGTCAP